MNRNESLQVIGVLTAAYPHVVGRLSKAQADGWVEVYSAAILDLDYTACRAAVERLIKSSRWLHVADIREAVVTTTRGQARSGVEAWRDVKRAIGRVGIYGTPRFDDQLVARIVSGLGWVDLCNSTHEIADRARFVDAYDRLTRDGRVEAQASRAASAPALPSRGPALELVAGLAKRLTGGE